MNESDVNPFIEDLIDDFYKVQAKVFPDEPTAAQNIVTHLTKVLVLTCASYYEQKLQNAYIIYAQRESERYADKPHNFDIDKRDKSVYQKFSFGRIDNPSDNRQLPELRNLLEPLKFFGERFRDKVFSDIDGDTDKEREVKAFQEIFAIRNLIAHQTFVEFNSGSVRGKSFQDIKGLHDDAVKFVNYLITQFS